MCHQRRVRQLHVQEEPVSRCEYRDERRSENQTTDQRAERREVTETTGVVVGREVRERSRIADGFQEVTSRIVYRDAPALRDRRRAEVAKPEGKQPSDGRR